MRVPSLKHVIIGCTFPEVADETTSLGIADFLTKSTVVNGTTTEGISDVVGSTND